MPGTHRSGRRPSVETLLRDAGMNARLTQEACRAAAAEHRDIGRALTAVYEQAERAHRSVEDALAELRRSRITLAPDPGHLQEAA